MNSQAVVSPWTLDPSLQKSDPISFSEFKTWRNCSAAGWFRYVQKHPSKPKPYLDFGNAVHGAIEAYFRVRLGNRETGNPSEEAIRMATHQASTLVRMSPSLRQGMVNHIELATTLVREYLEAFGTLRPLAVEAMLEARIGTLIIRGKPDLIALDDEDQIVVIDFKTAKNLASEITNDQRLQLTFYRMLARAAFGWSLDRGAIHLFAKQKKTVKALETILSEEDERVLLHQVDGVIRSIAAGIVFPNRGSEFCNKRFCDFAHTCEGVFGGVVAE